MPKTLRLACQLTDPEKLVVSGNLSAAITALEAAKAEKKEAMKEHNESIKEWETSVHTLNVSLSTGTCEREVEVEDRKDPETGVSTCYRLDTNEPVNTRSLDPEERQLTIGQAPGPAPAETLGTDAAGRTEEQNAAGSPEEAEAMRDTRIAEEKATQAFDSIQGIDPMVEIKVGDEWVEAHVANKTEFHFEANGKLYDVSKHGISWRLKQTWADLVAVSEEAARLAEIEKLAAEQAADKPKALLSSRRAKAEAKRIKVQDADGNPIVPPAETPPSDDHPANGGPGDGLTF